jgi:uncharacterized protein (DUF1501 family)
MSHLDEPSAEQVLAALSLPFDDSPHEWSRRKFLASSAAGAGVSALSMSLPSGVGRALGVTGSAHAAETDGAGSEVSVAGTADAILVLVMMSGGNDGLNTVIPYGNSSYITNRGTLALPAAGVLDIGSGYGFHPSMPKLKARYDQGKVAVVRGVGYNNPDLSHFTSMALWMRGLPPGVTSGTGWIGRYLDGLGAASDNFNAVAIGGNVPLHMAGRTTKATALPTNGNSLFGVNRRNASDARMFDAISAFGGTTTQLGGWGDTWAVSGRVSMAQAERVAPLYTPALPGGNLVAQMTLAARLINANMGIRVLSVEIGGFDTHSNQLGDHATLLGMFDSAVDAFYANLAPLNAGRVTIMTFSEFGRRLKRNDSAGTDHGTASCAFVIGERVRGGLHGQEPNLAAPDRNGNLVASVDYRSLYATMLDRWLGADSQQVLGASYSHLDLFTGAAGVTFPNIDGYWLVSRAGAVYAFGKAPFKGAVTSPTAPIVGIAATPSKQGYWICDSNGSVYAFGNAGFFGSLNGVPLSAPIVGISATSSGQGYWLLGRDGGVFSFGDAIFYGSTGNLRLNQPVVGMASAPGSPGYWFVARDGGIFSYGPGAAFFGSTGAMTLNQPIVGMAATANGRGYWLVARDGGIFAFGNAAFFGSTGAMTLNSPITGMLACPRGGYWLVAEDGGIFAFGAASFEGSAAEHLRNDTIVGMAG